MSLIFNTDEAVKLQQHLDLLREQYVKLQQRHADLEQKYARVLATSGNVSPDHFVSRLLKVVSELYDKALYRWVCLILDCTFKLSVVLFTALQ